MAIVDLVARLPITSYLYKHMFTEFASILLVAGILIVISLVSGRFFARFGFSSLIITLIIGVLIGNGGPFNFRYDFPLETLRISEIAMCLIIFSGGLESRWTAFKPILWKGITLATLGVILSTAVVGIFVHLIFQWPLPLSLLIGAIISSTDAAAVYSILEHTNIKLKPGLSETLELESGTNDPMAWFLTLALTTVVLVPETDIALLGLHFLKSMSIGLASGLILGKLTQLVITKTNLKKGQNPVLLLAVILILYSVNTLAEGSAFLAVFTAGIYLGNVAWAHKDINLSFFEGMTWLMETILFLILGLQVYIYDLPDVWLEGLVISAVLIFLGRPISTFASLIFFKGKQFRQGLFLSWVGLRGATPIIFALVPVVQHVPGAEKLFNITFIVVLVSIIFQSMTVKMAARVSGQLQE